MERVTSGDMATMLNQDKQSEQMLTGVRKMGLTIRSGSECEGWRRFWEDHLYHPSHPIRCILGFLVFGKGSYKDCKQFLVLCSDHCLAEKHGMRRPIGMVRVLLS